MGDFELLLIRHGVAEDWAPGGDSERPLTNEGRSQIARAARGLSELGLLADVAICSPFLRARQTAEIYLSIIGPEAPTEIWSGLTPPSPAQATMEELLTIGKRLSGARLAVFGHNPNISSVLSLLVAGHGQSYFNVAPGDVAHLQIPTSLPFVRSGVSAHAVVLGFYPRQSLEVLGATQDGA